MYRLQKPGNTVAEVGMQPVTPTSSNTGIITALLNRKFVGVPERESNSCEFQSSALKYKYLYIIETYHLIYVYISSKFFSAMLSVNWMKPDLQEKTCAVM